MRQAYKECIQTTLKSGEQIYIFPQFLIMIKLFGTERTASVHQLDGSVEVQESKNNASYLLPFIYSK